MRYLILALAVTATMLPATQASAEGTRITGEALRAAVEGKSYTGRTRRGGTWESTYEAGGSFKVRVLDSDWKDSGTWEIDDDRLCSERSKRGRMCYEVMKVSADEYHWVDERGETVKSFIVLGPDEKATVEELQEYCRENLASYKTPREIEFLDELPKSAMLKLLRRELRAEEIARQSAD